MTNGSRLLAVAIALLGACSGDDSNDQKAVEARGCSIDRDCQPSQLCIFGLCSDSCISSEDCRNGGICLDSGRGTACARLQDNACVTTANCPARMRCVGGRCLTDCEAGSGTECLDGEVCLKNVCVPGLPDASIDASDQAEVDSAGGSNQTAERPNADAGPLCAPGGVRCDQNTVVRCEEAGRTRLEETCPFVCEDGACTGSCTPKTLRCDAQDRERCNESGDWETIEKCPSVCTPAGCQTACIEGSRQCSGMALMRCTSGTFIEETTCGFICDQGVCIGECLPGSKACTSGDAVSCGADGMWMEPKECSNTCADGACTGVCDPGTKRCAGTTAFQVCSANGQWGMNESCGGLACYDGKCTGLCSPGASRCSGSSSVQTCEAKGEWGTAMACPNQVCIDDRCTGACTPGLHRCDPTNSAHVQTCSDEAQWEAGSACPFGACRDGVCTGECTASARRCDPANVMRYQVCGSDGTWSAAQACPQSGTCMASGQCAAPPVTSTPPPITTPPPVTMHCEASQVPDWYSSAQAGGNSSLDDSRWGTAPAAAFAASPGFNPGGYVILLDRVAKQFAVSVRVTMGPNETPASNDYVYFGVTPNLAGAPSGRSVVIPLMEMNPGEIAKPVPSVQTSSLTDTWHTDNATWVEHVAAWRGGTNDGFSWAVSFKVDFGAALIDATKPFRIAIAAHAEGVASDLSTPPGGEMLATNPGAWALGSVDPNQCLPRVVLRQ